MTWTNNDFRSYPSRFPRALREAAYSTPNPFHLGGFNSRSEAESEALLHRKYRFLLRSNPGVDFSLDALLQENAYRTRIVKEPFAVFGLYLIAKPVVSTLSGLNPHLSDIFAMHG